MTANTPKQVRNREHIPVNEFDYAFATDTLGGGKISMMVATESIHESIFAVVARVSKISSIGWDW